MKNENIEFTQTTIPSTTYRYSIIYSSFSFCHSETNGGAICCESSSKSILFVNGCHFYHCYTDANGGSIYAQNKIEIKCSYANNCFAQILCGFLCSLKNSFFRSISSSYCKATNLAMRISGEKAEIKTMNETYQYSEGQVSGVSSHSDIGLLTFLTICHCYDQNACTMSIKNKQATLSYSNLFNVSSSSHSTEGLFVFGNGVQANIFNCVFQHFSQKKIITFYDHNHQETIIFNSCTFESNTPISFPSCTTYNLKFISNPTFIITSIPRKCDYPISQCNEKYSMHSLLTLFCSILISI